MWKFQFRKVLNKIFWNWNWKTNKVFQHVILKIKKQGDLVGLASLGLPISAQLMKLQTTVILLLSITYQEVILDFQIKIIMNLLRWFSQKFKECICILKKILRKILEQLMWEKNKSRQFRNQKYWEQVRGVEVFCNSTHCQFLWQLNSKHLNLR